MIARLEIGEVLLTTRMSEVFLSLGQAVCAGNATLTELDTKRVLIESGQARGLSKRQPTIGVIATSQLDLHVAFALARPERQVVERLLVKVECDAH